MSEERDDIVALLFLLTPLPELHHGHIKILKAGLALGFGADRAFRIVEIGGQHVRPRSEEHTSELQSLMRISYAVFCLKKKTNNKNNQDINQCRYKNKSYT